MTKARKEFLKTIEYPPAESEPSDLVFERGKVIGAPVKVMRTGRDKPDSGWHIVEVYFKNSRENLNQTLVKVNKAARSDSEKGLQKIVPLKSLEKINPEIRFLLFESDRDYVLYEDREQCFKIGLVIDVSLEEESLLVMLSPGGEDITAPLDRIKRSCIIDKSSDPKVLERVFQEEIKKRTRTASEFDGDSSSKRSTERKNLVYYLQVTNRDTEQTIGHAVNISSHGFMLTAGDPIAPNTPLHLKLFLPKEIQGSRYFEFSATSRWCRLDENPDYHNTGFQFKQLSTVGEKVIRDLIDKYCF